MGKGTNRKSNQTWFSRDLPVSPAWLATSNVEKTVYLIFLLKRQYSSSQKKRVGLSLKVIIEPQILNDGEIQFTYKEAKEKYGISRSSFLKAIDGLIAKGFLVKKQAGAAQGRIPTLFGFSDEWRNYGTTNFKPQKPKKNVWHRPKKFQGTQIQVIKKNEGGGDTL